MTDRDKSKPGPKRNSADEAVDKTLEESFPASDPPSWTGTQAGDGRNPRKE